MAKGRLQVEVYTAENALPLPNTKVEIFSTDGTLLEVAGTDESGKTAELSLNAPEQTFSEIPTETRPYSEYNIIVSNDSYPTIEIKNVQILPNVTALQPVDMSFFVDQLDQREIVIEDNVLYGDYPAKIPEDSVKDISTDSGFVVLDKPVIPEFVVVHTAAPSVAATDYWIPFTSYIKNVACSEIYSTWPKETIRANVLAIISFTLNRVYTEWYRSQGKYFTITSTTAYDQYFKYGRTIYKEISQIVDELFSTYITRSGIRQPILTQYCDGKNTTCPNAMSQWGSKYLGDKGYTAIEILKNYYGSGVYLVTAEKVTGVPVSWPGRTLQQGSRGSDVKTIQQQLTTIHKNYPAIPSLVADGIYGPGTRKAVEIFQTTFNLSPTGTVTYSTWYKISQIYVAVEKLGPQ
ncbi:MAG: peptidoglycan-binding protein [Lachnospirales bacterium]